MLVPYNSIIIQWLQQQLLPSSCHNTTNQFCNKTRDHIDCSGSEVFLQGSAKIVTFCCWRYKFQPIFWCNSFVACFLLHRFFFFSLCDNNSFFWQLRLLLFSFSLIIAPGTCRYHP
mmetsp:Transcript_9581/g.16572  ORF Transcript_9581/g.16572 Transcript_9581/m.16572 type:complete len:116 (+) Transcript_9581:237-584(+)